MTDVFNLLASATKPEQVKDQGPTEEQVKEIGFKLTAIFDHDHYHTNRYKKGCLEVEFTYENDKLHSCELTISELNCMPVTFQEIKAISDLIGHWKP